MRHLTIEFVAMNDAGDEVTHQLPARYAVCSGCEGHGTIINPSIGNHAFTREEFDREFDDEQQIEYMTRGGIYDIACTTCNGEKVVAAVDRNACRSDEQTTKLLALYDELEKDRRQGNADWAREIRMQELMGGMVE